MTQNCEKCGRFMKRVDDTYECSCSERNLDYIEYLVAIIFFGGTMFISGLSWALKDVHKTLVDVIGLDFFSCFYIIVISTVLVGGFCILYEFYLEKKSNKLKLQHLKE